MKTYDLIVLGGGRSTILAQKAAELGKKVAIIEKSALGGTCPNRGCVPSKLLIGHAHVARAIKESGRHFIDSTINNIDQEKIFTKTNAYVIGVEPRYDARLKEMMDIYYGEGTFVSDKMLKVNGEELTAKTILIGTGTRPRTPEHEKAWSSDDIFPLNGKIPKSISIVGSGVIACELANFFDAIDIKTTMLVRTNGFLAQEDVQIAKIFKDEFAKNMDVRLNTSIKEIVHENGMFSMQLQNKNGELSTHKSEAVLYATGRVSNADRLKLENTNIKTNKRGFIQRDKNLETSVEGVYVIGDASGEYMLQHSASHEVNKLGNYLYGEAENIPVFKYMTHAVFTDPEVASVGITEEQAKAQNIKYVAAMAPWTGSAKAMSTLLDYPRTKFLVNPKNYEILGCHMIGPESSTLIHQVLTVIHIDNDIRYLRDMMYIHPALNESFLASVREVIGKCKS